MAVTAQRARRPYRSPDREARARATRQQVLRAASALFADFGYASTTIRSVAARAGVSVPTVETMFGTKARLLKAAIDVAIAGDDEPVPMLDRDWAAAAMRAADPATLLSLVVRVLVPAQARSSGLVLAVFEGAAADPDLAAVAAQLSAQREVMAAWIVARFTALGTVRQAAAVQAADTVFALMEPAAFARFTRQRGWTAARYEQWITSALSDLLAARPGPGPAETTPEERTHP